jgi:hypothetical protein
VEVKWDNARLVFVQWKGENSVDGFGSRDISAVPELFDFVSGSIIIAIDVECSAIVTFVDILIDILDGRDASAEFDINMTIVFR